MAMVRESLRRWAFRACAFATTLWCVPAALCGGAAFANLLPAPTKHAPGPTLLGWPGPLAGAAPVPGPFAACSRGRSEASVGSQRLRGAGVSPGVDSRRLVNRALQTRQRPPSRECQPLQLKDEQKSPVQSISQQTLSDIVFKGVPVGFVEYGWFLRSHLVAVPRLLKLAFADIAIFTDVLESIMMKVALGVGAVLIVELIDPVRGVKRGNTPRSKLFGHVVFAAFTVLLAWIGSHAARTLAVSSCNVATWFHSGVPLRTAGHLFALRASVAGAVAGCSVGSISRGLTNTVVLKRRDD